MPLVAYFGGRVLSNIAVVAVFWTGDVDINVQQKIGDFYGAIVSSSYVDWLSEYDTGSQHIGRGRFVGAVTITPSTVAQGTTSLTNAQIASELAAQIATGGVPAPSVDAAGNVNTLYMIELPPGYAVDLLGARSCTGFCGYHWTTSLAGTSVPYVVLPDMRSCNGACGTDFDDMTILRSHEMAEAMTDTESGLVDPADLAAGTDVYPMAWAGDGGAQGEIGDLCWHALPDEHGLVAGYEVQKLWSNFAASCVLGVPICSGDGKPPACRPCTARDDGAACAGATPVCDATTGRCRACEGDECPPAGADAGPGDAGGDAGASSAGSPRAKSPGCTSVGPAAGACAIDALLVACAGVGLARRRRSKTEL